MSEQKEIKYYSLDRILKTNAHYFMVIGERSNGKTYACLNYALEDYCKYGRQLAIFRRWDTDLKPSDCAILFDGIISNGLVSKYTHGEYNSIKYRAKRWYLMKTGIEGEKDVVSDEPFAYAFALNEAEHYKSYSYPGIGNILFDEFLTDKQYLTDEFVVFMNLISTVVRLRDDIKIFMCANTVNHYTPYFAEMGLRKTKNMKPGELEIYKYGNSKLVVAVEYSDGIGTEKPSNVYYGFNNQKLNMITGQGTGWMIGVYPHRPVEFKPKDIVFRYFIIFDGETLQADIISVDNNLFTFIHRKSTEIKNKDTDLIYSTEVSPKPNMRRRINVPTTKLEKKVADFFPHEKVFYADDEVGELVSNYLNWCRTTPL